MYSRYRRRKNNGFKPRFATLSSCCLCKNWSFFALFASQLFTIGVISSGDNSPTSMKVVGIRERLLSNSLNGAQVLPNINLIFSL